MEDLESINHKKETTNNPEAYERLFDKEICETATAHLLSVHEAQRVQFRDNLDAMFKLNVHFPSVYEISRKIAPSDPIVQTAALYHDYGRMRQLETKGDFNDGGIGSEQDHHIIGYNAFLEDIPAILSSDQDTPKLAIDDSLKSGALHTIAKAIKLHGLKGKAFEEDFAALTEREAQVVDIVSQIDDIANGTQCVGYLLREGQERKKNQSAGGFIPDENADSRAVTPEVMGLFRESTTFNRNAECKTYPDYYIFGAFLATRSLKNPDTREITKELLSLPITIMQHENIDGHDMIINRPFDSSLAAFKYIFDTQMGPEDATTAYKVLSDYYNYGHLAEES